MKDACGAAYRVQQRRTSTADGVQVAFRAAFAQLDGSAVAEAMANGAAGDVSLVANVHVVDRQLDVKARRRRPSESQIANSAASGDVPQLQDLHPRSQEVLHSIRSADVRDAITQVLKCCTGSGCSGRLDSLLHSFSHSVEPAAGSDTDGIVRISFNQVDQLSVSVLRRLAINAAVQRTVIDFDARKLTVTATLGHHGRRAAAN